METKLKFKVGDKVRVKSLEWYNEKKNEKGVVRIDTDNCVNFTAEMLRLCGEIMQVEEIRDYFYIMKGSIFSWQDWMLEEAVVEDIKKKVLTKEVAQAVVRCTKYLLNNENENANLQKKLFEIGCKWASGGKEVAYEDGKYLYVDNNLNITMGEVGEEDFYKNEPSAELSVNYVLNIEIKDMETKEQTKEEVTKEQKELKVRNKIAKAGLQPIKKEEAEKLFIGTKFFCVNNEEAEKLQRKLLECGFRWSDIGDKIDVNRWAIFVCGGGMLVHYNKEAVSWSDDSYIAILVEDILQIEIIPEETPKFDPNTLQDFQKVLYRFSDIDWWRLGFFEQYNEKQNNKFWIIGQNVQPYEQCVPYNHETEYLKGQCLDAPAFYKNW